MKVHVGTDRPGVMHTITTTDAAIADSTQLPHLLHGPETTLHGETTCYKAEDKRQWSFTKVRDRSGHSERRTRCYQQLSALPDAQFFHAARDSCLARVSVGRGRLTHRRVHRVCLEEWRDVEGALRCDWYQVDRKIADSADDATPIVEARDGEPQDVGGP